MTNNDGRVTHSMTDYLIDLLFVDCLSKKGLVAHSLTKHVTTAQNVWQKKKKNSNGFSWMEGVTSEQYEKLDHQMFRTVKLS